ncbi:hypothetical protein EOK75_11625 [Pseudorhodobacter turbinis]|uniref:Uncharacterized protein n=1 Tax=Pseudorhodobacter turbinis TaxID=2500533 RepID=A0A4P8EHR5_9RHOB|nr:hypothetical protein [Pseudorhodobacter turbinis]QCO56322.1 hypothetical protein EOK75_11625 [Pseudorhodobacter turbinis]
MQDLLEPIIHKTKVFDLQMPLKHSGLSIGDAAELRLDKDGVITVWCRVSKRSFLIRRKVMAHLGNLRATADQILSPALQRGDHLRVRVVGLTPEHLATDGKAEMYISVWGTARNFQQIKPAPAKPAPVTPAPVTPAPVTPD